MAEPLKIGLAGLGTVGTAVVDLLERGRDKLIARCGRPIEVVAVGARSRSKKRSIDLKKFRWIADPAALAADPAIDVFVEVIGGAGDPARRAVETALAAGKPVVTANKALLARHGHRLAVLAERHQVALNFEASVAGGIPIVKTLRESLNGDAVTRIYGILNGTCNYILSRMERDRLAFADCLREAQRLGYAEADPSFDVEGHDTAQKLAILASLSFGTKIDEAAVFVEGISSITLADLDAAAELGYRVKLLGVAVRTEAGIEQRVHPTMVPKESAIAQVLGVTNAVTVDADGLAPITLVGPGAGGMATASAVVSDLADIARGVRTPPFGRPAARMSAIRRAPMQRHEGGYYIRLLARDRPGSAAAIARRLAQQQISIESIVQRQMAKTQSTAAPGRSGEPVPVILVTYATTEDAVRKALAAVRRDRVISGRPQVIRIEKN
ncbi:MAG TPA: homoserine dehydrogenase [Xanthobacteraceae bacterium]|jgi:homoserine dehydrogenase|nr:homoserine dehydrogenase [Xanthobacteraceae bacterium]